MVVGAEFNVFSLSNKIHFSLMCAHAPPSPSIHMLTHAFTHLFSVWRITWRWACPAFQCGGNDGHMGWVYQASKHAIFIHLGAWIKRHLYVIQMISMVWYIHINLLLGYVLSGHLRCWYIIKWQLHHAKIPAWSVLQLHKLCIFKTQVFMFYVTHFTVSEFYVTMVF